MALCTSPQEWSKTLPQLLSLDLSLIKKPRRVLGFFVTVKSGQEVLHIKNTGGQHHCHTI